MNIEIENPKPIEIDNDVKMYRGPRGYSSYEIALQNGFKGTEKDFLNSLKGKDGEPGLKGDAFTYNDFTPEQLETLKGPKGFSPIVETSNVENGTKITITDATSSHEFTILNGKNGENGVNGEDGQPGKNGIDGTNGENGFSPIVAIKSIDGGTKVNITDKDGVKEFTVLNGKDGKQGIQGEPGQNYEITEEDYSAIADAVFNKMINAEEVAY